MKLQWLAGEPITRRYYFKCIIANEFKYYKKVKELYKEFNCSPIRTLLLPWIQVPLWITVSLALRTMSAYPVPFLETPLRCVPGFLYGGFGPWTDLHLPDPTWFFPLSISFTHLMNVHFASKFAVTETQKRLMNVMRILAVCMAPLVTQVPTSLAFYWLTSSIFSLFQNIYLRK